MKKTAIAVLMLTLAVPMFGATDVVTAVKPAMKHTAKDVFAPFKYLGVGVVKGVKHLGQDMRIVKKAPVKKAGDGGGPIPTCRPGTNCNPDDQVSQGSLR